MLSIQQFPQFAMKKVIFFIVIFISVFAFGQFPQPVFNAPLNTGFGTNNIASVSGVGNGVPNSVFQSTYEACGVGNGSYWFDASNDGHIFVNDHPTLAFNSAFTMCAWIVNYDPATEQEFFSKNNYNFGVNLGKIEVEIPDGNQKRFGTIANNVWVHIAVVRNGPNLRVFQNGVFVGTSTTGYNTSSIGGDLYLGRYNSGAYNMNGQMQDARIYDVALSDDEVFNVYNSFTIHAKPIQTICGTGGLISVRTIHGTGHTFQWYKNGSLLAGETASSFYVSAPSLTDVYSVVGLSSCGNYTTNGISLQTISGIPVISTILGSGNLLCNNSSSTITCSALGQAMSYRWLINGTIINTTTDGGVFKNFNTATLSITGFPTSIVGTVLDFTCSVSGVCDGVLSPLYTVSVVGVPEFSGLSLGESACVGSSIVLSATGVYANTYRWRRGFSLNALSDGGIYTNFNTETLAISALPGNSTTTVLGYQLRAFGACGTTTSALINITVNGITSISGPNINTSYCSGNTKVLSLTTNAGVGITYQWGMWDSGLTTLTTISDNLFDVNIGTINGVNAINLTISGMVSSITSLFIATATGVCGSSFQSSIAGFTFQQPVTATVLSGVTVCNGNTAVFNASITGSPLAMIWLRSTNGGTSYSAIVGENISIYDNTMTIGDNGKLFALSLAGFCGNFTTSGSLLNVQNNTAITTIVSPFACQGNATVFSVNAVSVNPIYQWFKNGVAIVTTTDGGVFGTSFTTSGLSISSSVLSMNGANLYATVDGDCGGLQTSATVSINVGTIAGVSINPTASFSTCLGSSISINALGTGTGVNYQWQYFLGSWQNITNTGGLFNGATSNQLTISNLPASLDGVNFRVSVSGTCGIGNTSEVSTLSVNFGPKVSVFGFNPKYCNNENTDLLEAFTDLTLPFSTVAGIYTAISGGAGLSTTGIGFNKAAFRPFVYNNTTPVSLRYTSAPNVLGCRNITTITSIVYSISGFKLAFVGLNNTFPSSQNSPETLVLTSTGGFFGTTTFWGTFTGVTQSGVVGNLFYPNNVTPAPTLMSSTKSVYIIGQFTEAISGCKDTTTAKINVFFPQTNYAFIPLTTLNGFIDLPNKSNFCSTDYALRSISFTGIITPEQNFISSPIFCIKNYAISISGIPSSIIGGNTYFEPTLGPFGMTRYDMNSFRFTPGMLSPGSYNLDYFYDFALSPFGCSSPARAQPNDFVQNTQQIQVLSKPIPPRVNNYSVCEDLLNVNHIIAVDGQNISYYTSTSTSSIISSLSGLNNVSLQQLGITTNTGIGIYKFYARQFINGCPSDVKDFSVIIKLKPSKPIFSSLMPGNKVCITGNTNMNKFSITATSPGISTYKWNIYHTNALKENNFGSTNSALYNDFILNSASEQVITITSESVFNGCESEPEFQLLALHQLPPVPSITGFYNGCLNFTNNMYQLPNIRFSVNYNQPVSFYTDFKFGSQTTSLGFGTSTFSGTSSQAFTSNQPILTAVGIAELLNFYVQNTITGCKSKIELSKNSTIFSRPARPVHAQVDVFCNNPSYGTISVSGTNINWYNEPNATTSGIASGSFFDVQNVMPANRNLKNDFIDTLFYATQTFNGCESSTTGVRFRMYEPFVTMPISSTPLTVPYINLQFGTQPCVGNAGYALIYNYSNTQIATHPLNGTKDLVIKNVLANTSLSASSFFESSNKIAYFMGSYTPLQNPKFEIYEYFKTSANKFCFSTPTLSGWQLLPRELPSAPILRDTAYCLPGVVGNIMALSTATGGSIPAFRWYEYKPNTISPKQYNNYLSSDPFPRSTISGSTLTGFYQSVFSASVSGQNLAISNNIKSDTTDYEYFVTQIVDGCESAASTIQKMKLYYTPALPVSTNKEEFCSGETILPFRILTNSLNNSQINWFTSTILSSIVATSVTSYMPTISTTLGWTTTTTSFKDHIIYINALEYQRNYPKLNFAGCRSAFVSDTIRIKAIPPTPVSSSLVKYCVQKTGITNPLTASGLAGQNSDFNWTNELNGSLTAANPNIGLVLPSTNKYFVSQNYDGCKSLIATVTVTVFNLPVVTFSGLSTSFCDGVLPSTLIGSNTSNLVSKHYSIYDQTLSVSGSAYLTTFGGANSHLAKIDVRTPAATSDKEFLLTYLVVDTNSCANQKSQIMDVFAKQIFSFDALDNKNVSKTEYCSNDEATLLLGNAPNGSFSAIPATAVVGNQFLPYAPEIISNSLILDSVKVKYNYFDNNNCPNVVEKKFVVKPSPSASFKMSSHCVGLVGMNGISTIVGKNGDGINYFSWFVNNDSISNQQNTDYNFIASGLYTISYYVESDLGCSTEFLADSTIDAYPVVRFDWNNICSGDITQFTNKSFIPVGGGLLKDVSWKFNTNPVFTVSSLTVNPSFDFGKSNAYPVTLKVSTQENCVTSLTSIVNILPVATLSGSNTYIENFETGTGNWFATGENSSWVWGQSGTQTSINTTPHWATNQNNGNYNTNERSYLYGPCLDIRELNRPMLRMDMNYNTANANNDGLVLQFALSTDTVWQPVGNQGTGINWYKSRNILNNPGEQVQFITNILNNPQTATSTGTYFRQIGWNGKSQDWITARNTLDEAKNQSIAQQTKIRLRLAFATSGNVVSDGFAIDNIVIGSRSKKSLVENFANANSLASNTAQLQTLDRFFVTNKDDIIGINYHTGFPNPDVFNTFNPSDPSTRVLYYGVESIPRAAVNGELVSGSSTNIGLNFLLDQTLLDPAFEIRALYSNQNNLFSVTAQFVSNQNIESTNATPIEYLAHIAVVEKNILAVPNENLSKSYINVLKRMLPNPAGTSLIDTWEKGNNKTVYQNWAYSNTDVYNKDSLAAIVFIQDKETKKILQAQLLGLGIAQTSLPTNIETTDYESKTGKFTVYPNPSSSVFYIYYTLSDTNYWELFDVTGRKLLFGILDNTSKSEIDVSKLNNGVYHLKIANTIKKLVVNH